MSRANEPEDKWGEGLLGLHLAFNMQLLTSERESSFALSSQKPLTEFPTRKKKKKKVLKRISIMDDSIRKSQKKKKNKS